MVPVLPLPRLLFGAGALASLAGELASLGVRRPLLLSDRGLERAGAVAAALRALPSPAATFVDVPENPTLAGADAAFAAYRDAGCDGIVAVGGGSVLDTSKFVAAMARSGLARAADMQGKPERVSAVAPLVAIPTTVGTGSESSPVAALHDDPNSHATGTRSPRLVPRVAICDPDLTRTLPRRLVAATGIDALSHCLEGYLSDPGNPVIDALALDGLARAYADLAAALEPENDTARASLMAAAFAGGAAIHKGLGPAHAVALACGDQNLHHGVLVAAALPLTVALVAPHAPAKAHRIAATLGLRDPAGIPDGLRALIRTLGLPATYREAGYRAGPVEALLDSMVASPFNRASPYKPTRNDYRAIIERLLT